VKRILDCSLYPLGSSINNVRQPSNSPCDAEIYCDAAERQVGVVVAEKSLGQPQECNEAGRQKIDDR